MPMGSWELHHAKLEEWAANYTGPKFHAIFADPPYFLEFCGKEWDTPTDNPTAFPKAGNLGGFANGNRPSFARQGNKGMAAQEMFRLWGEALKPLLYPGALVLLFSGTRTWHRLACGMEDAGFEMWDTINWCSVREPDYECGWYEWITAQGMPKSQDLGKLIDAKFGADRQVVGYDASRARPNRQYEGGAIGNIGGTGKPSDRSDNGATISAPATDAAKPWEGFKTLSLAPAHEPILCFRLPTPLTYAETAMEHNCGCLNVDAARIPYASDADRETAHNNALGPVERYKTTKQIFNGGRASGGFADTHSPVGRYPKNIIFDEQAAALLDEQAGNRASGANPARRNGDKTRAIYGKFNRQECNPLRGADAGATSRLFYCSKSSPREREAGCETLPAQLFAQSNGAKAAIERGESFGEAGVDCGMNVVKRVRNFHPCLKPITLCKYIASLLLPPDSVQPRRLLIPFAGSGSEMIGALLAGWDEVVGVEQDAQYIPIAKARLQWWTEQTRDGLITDPAAILAVAYGPDEAEEREALEAAGQGSLFV